MRCSLPTPGEGQSKIRNGLGALILVSVPNKPTAVRTGGAAQMAPPPPTSQPHTLFFFHVCLSHSITLVSLLQTSLHVCRSPLSAFSMCLSCVLSPLMMTSHVTITSLFIYPFAFLYFSKPLPPLPSSLRWPDTERESPETN